MPGLVEEWTWEQKQGDTARFTVQHTEDDGTPIDFTGCTAELRISRRRGMAPIQLWDAPPHIEITDPENGLVSIQLSAEDTSDWGKHPELVHQVLITFPDGEVLTILEGRLAVRLA